MPKSVTVWIDGASRGNPGPAGIGVHIEKDNGEILADLSEYIGNNITNNQAEYNALIKALEKCRDLDVNNVELRSDSQLLVRQMKGEYDVNSKNLESLYKEAKQMSSKFDKISFTHISREKNKISDELANKAINQKD